MMALCAFIYGVLQRDVRRAWLRRAGTGLAFGIGAAVVTYEPIFRAEGYQADARGAFIGMAAAFGGPIAAAAASIIAIAARVHIGGGGVPLGVLAILLTAGAALLWQAKYGALRQQTTWSWSLICLASSVPSVTIMATAAVADLTSAFAIAVLVTLGVLVFGKMLETEQRRGRRERELTSEATTDSLTGLPNRRAFDEFTKHLEDSSASDVLLLLIDVDHFKSINDRYGHDAGDNVLQEVGAKIKKLTRDLDFAARIGGEEFAVIVTSPALGAGNRIADRLLNGLQVPYGDPTEAMVTKVSIGGYHSQGTPFIRTQSYKFADQALYRSKLLGRDQVTLLTLHGRSE